MSVNGFDAVIFDLDGVITNTATLHSKAWKMSIDAFLETQSENKYADIKPFEEEKDYLAYVDGKPRYDGVNSFLKSRNIKLEFGFPTDKAGYETCCALGNKKNEIFHKLLEKDGAEVFDSTIKLVKELISNDVLVGVASSSKNCKKILETAGLSSLFPVRVDGVTSAEIGLNGKPEPDIFIEASNQLGVHPSRAVVVEDAESGVKAGQNGGFGLVIGIARHQNEHSLKTMGADIVVSDLEEISIENIETWFEIGLEEDMWSIRYTDYIPEQEKSRESLLSIGNGYFVTRGVTCECKSSNNHYPGTYMAGVYNTLSSKIADKNIENQDLVNCPNWIFSSFKIEDEDWVQLKDVKIIDFERRLNLRNGILSGWMLIEDKKGRQSLLETLRFVSMANRNMAALEHAVSPLNYSAKITLYTEIDGDINNQGVDRYKSLNQEHTKVLETGYNDKCMWVHTQTTESKIQVSVAAHVYAKCVNSNVHYSKKDKKTGATCSAVVPENGDIAIVKIVAISQSINNNNPLKFVKSLLEKENDFELLAANTRRAWHKIWEKSDIKIEGDRKSQKLTRLHLYHMMLSFSPLIEDLDISIPARGLHGEAYRGHIFWDELFVLPLYNMLYPNLTKTALMYRYRRLNAAREYAVSNGYKGAMFPWQSGSDGSEQTQIIHLNPKSGKWDKDNSRLQRHVSLAIAMNVIRYYQHTGDKVFMQNYGMEMLYEVCRFWASLAKLEKDNKYHIKGVMGPDEFHEKCGSKSEAGLSDNAYTNIMSAWLWNKTLSLTSYFGEKVDNLMQKIELSKEELNHWLTLCSNIYIPINKDGIIEQFSGYFNLKELDWKAYRQKYDNIYRMDRILKAEGKSTDDYKLAKQADTLMTFYNLNEIEIKQVFETNGIKLPENYTINNFKYYFERTSHGSSLSKLVHADLSNKWQIENEAWPLFFDALQSDYKDVQGGTTGEGIHTGVMAGSIMHVITSFAGVNFKDYNINIDPKLPKHWLSLSCSFNFRNTDFKLIVYRDSINILTSQDVGIKIQGIPIVIEKDEWWNIEI